MVHHLEVADLAPDSYKKFTENYFNAAKVLTADDTKVKLTVVEQVDGKDVIHQRMDPGIMFVSARSTIVKQYTVANSDGFVFFLTSKGNEELEKKYASAIGKDVVATLEVNFWHFKANGSGTSVTHVACSKPNGSIPDMVVDNMMKKQSESAIKVSEMIRTGKI